MRYNQGYDLGRKFRSSLAYGTKASKKNVFSKKIIRFHSMELKAEIRRKIRNEIFANRFMANDAERSRVKLENLARSRR